MVPYVRIREGASAKSLRRWVHVLYLLVSLNILSLSVCYLVLAVCISLFVCVGLSVCLALYLSLSLYLSISVCALRFLSI